MGYTKMQIKKLIWKFRYARHMRRRTLLGWKLCWEAAGIALHEITDQLEDDPVASCDEEISYWTD